MKTKSAILSFTWILLSGSIFSVLAGGDYTGQFEPDLLPNKEDYERVVFRPVTGVLLGAKLKLPEGAHLTSGRIADPRTEGEGVLVLLVEGQGENPAMYVDLDGSETLTDDEIHTMKPSESDNPYLWEITAGLRMKTGIFKTCPVFIRYFKKVKVDKMGPDDRLLTQSTEVIAGGRVEIKGKKVLFQYAFNAQANKIDPESGLLGVDMDGDGVVDIGKMSPESTKADEEKVVFRVGDLYVSTKKVDMVRNQIVVTEREAKDYKRAEIYMNKVFPDFKFTDFEGKKHTFSEFRGKYVLLDIWGFWCGPCRRELPYIREANRRFQSRNLAIVGLNTDPNLTIESMRKGLTENGMTWTQGEFSSVATFLSDALRVNSFPTTFLISPEGKVLSIGRTDRDEPDLRGSDLLDSLDEILPKQ